MSDALWLGLAAVLSVSGMAWLALAMEVHWAQVVQGRRPRRRTTPLTLRGLGASALMLSLWVCLVADRPSMAVLVWVMLMTAAALVVALTLGHRPRWLALWSLTGPTRGPGR